MCFIPRTTRLSNKLFEQGYVKERLKSSWRKFYDRYKDLIKQLTNAKWHSVAWPNTMECQPSTDRTLCQSVTFLPNSTFYRIMRGFHKTSATGVAYFSGHLVPSHLRLAYVLPVKTNSFPELVIIFRTMLFEYPSALPRFCPLRTFVECIHVWMELCVWRFGINVNTGCFIISVTFSIANNSLGVKCQGTRFIWLQ